MRADGDPLWIRAVVELMRDPAGGVEMIRGFLSDQSPIKQSNSRSPISAGASVT